MATVLGGLSPARFLAESWQRRPRLFRGALPGFGGILERDELFRLAARDDVTSRLVLGRGRRWQRHDGPLDGPLTASLPRSHWTLLVHGVESLVVGGWELLGQFDFIRAARIDDLMVSYAADGGSVGPHFDQYDVFLLQGPGRRRWRIARGGSRALDPRAAIKVLAEFAPEEEHLLEPGDMLYLPPGVAHHGVAEGPCFTYSIGFLAPSRADLVRSFLGYLGWARVSDDEALVEVRDGRVPDEPLDFGADLVRRVEPVLASLRWDRALVEEFLGCYLTRPRPRARFTPGRPLSEEAFARRLAGRGRLELALPTRGLIRGRLIFLNGEAHRVRPRTLEWFKPLVRTRSLPLPLGADSEALPLLHAWYTAGWIHPTSVRMLRR
jgi:50S ribosomal protein L16 3-hydroxylase